jgi:hypothetical protein
MDVHDEISPCSAHRAVHDVGVTWTTIRRRHRVQKRGGSIRRRSAHASWLTRASAAPQCPQ